MSRTEIKSENQSGGITAKNVNVGNNLKITENVPEKERRSRRLFWWIFGLVGLVASATVIIEFFL